MNLAIWALAALPLAAPPKLLINAQLDARSAAGGLEREFRALVAAQPQASWIAYAVPVLLEGHLGCDYVSPDGRAAPGVVHLEPSDQAVLLFRVESGAVSRIRVLSSYCEIDAAGAPLHWLDDVRPAESVTLLQSFASTMQSAKGLRSSAIAALSVSSDPAALEFLIGLARKDPDSHVRSQCVSVLTQSRDPRATAFLEDLLRH
ncbi:MAG: HEAT repeat domain-containing protein [Acidobacteriia bacterium]|nr:HEAT repeat domain-containing protein [Terriglobia bacterium]